MHVLGKQNTQPTRQVLAIHPLDNAGVCGAPASWARQAFPFPRYYKASGMASVPICSHPRCHLLKANS
jgi:hypothetical protein